MRGAAGEVCFWSCCVVDTERALKLLVLRVTDTFIIPPLCTWLICSNVDIKNNRLNSPRCIHGCSASGLTLRLTATGNKDNTKYRVFSSAPGGPRRNINTAWNWSTRVCCISRVWFYFRLNILKYSRERYNTRSLRKQETIKSGNVKNQIQSRTVYLSTTQLNVSKHIC